MGPLKHPQLWLLCLTACGSPTLDKTRGTDSGEPSIEGPSQSPDQLAATWNAQKAERERIVWPDDDTFKNLQAKVKRAISSMRAPA